MNEFTCSEHSVRIRKKMHHWKTSNVEDRLDVAFSQLVQICNIAALNKCIVDDNIY